MSGLYPYDHYDCSTYALTFRHYQQECFGHYISAKALRTLILDTIRTASAYAISNETEFIEKVRAASEVRQAQTAKDLRRTQPKWTSFWRWQKKYTDFSVLTTSMIYEFVDKILVHAPDKSSGDRAQEVDIYLKFIGKFDVPMPELTPEELAEMEKQRQQRAYYRERSKRQREREKQKKLSEQEKTA